ncbi:MAG: hypothetical protein DI535_21420 [Citrobacter freundii]|nr:MAG: hypothetical protein DI535_21420 [Citrobacter freundii]
MKKHLILITLLIAGSMAASAQLANFKWKGIANVPDPLESILDFRKDSVMLSVQGSLVETMSYELRGDTLVLTKLDGLSPCAQKSTGLFKILWKDNTFTLTSLQDECPQRAEAFVGEPWVRVKEE